MARKSHSGDDRRVRRGQLTTRLVTPEGMCNALRILLADTNRYVIAVSRPSYSWRSGREQEAAIVINDGDSLALEELDPRLRHSKQVRILITQADGGVAVINLTSRSWASWNKTPALTQRMISVNQCLLNSACTRIIGIFPATLLFLAPLLILLISFFAWGFSSASTRRAVFAKGSINFVAPHWFSSYSSVLLDLWPVFILLAAAVILVNVMSGGLSVWPSELSGKSAHNVIHGIQINILSPKSVSGMLAGIIVGLILAYISFLFTRLLA
jgi:hypothetical protein